jgi:hypothetical protein
LNIDYERSGPAILHQIVSASRITVDEAVSSDEWDSRGHNVYLFLPEDVLREVPFKKQGDYASKILADLNACARSVSSEYYHSVLIELGDDNDPLYERSVAFLEAPPINPDALSIWQPGLLRLFVSHRDEHKAEAKRLANALQTFGISCFVAHDTIEPMSTWQKEIEKGLQTMEVMLALVTDGFHDSVWTNQEVGFALGKGVPILTVKLGQGDPAGFIGSIQAMKGNLESLEESAIGVYKLIAKKLGQRARLQRAVVSAFCASPNFNETVERFDLMRKLVERLSEEEVYQMIDSFYKNDQLHNSIYLLNNNQRLKRFLEAVTKEEVDIDGRFIRVGDDIPF